MVMGFGNSHMLPCWEGPLYIVVPTLASEQLSCEYSNSRARVKIMLLKLRYVMLASVILTCIQAWTPGEDVSISYNMILHEYNYQDAGGYDLTTIVWAAWYDPTQKRFDQLIEERFRAICVIKLQLILTSLCKSLLSVWWYHRHILCRLCLWMLPIIAVCAVTICN